MIKEAFVSFEVAKLLKEKGFYEPCIATYNSTTKKFHVEELYLDWSTQWESYISVPTHQMAMAWLREKYNIYIEISLYKTSEDDIEPKKSRKAPYYTFGVWDAITGDNVDKRLTNDFIGDTYEDAVEAALKYCLENLI